MGRQGADRIVEDLVQRQHPHHHDDSGNRADDDRGPRLDVAGGSGDGDERGDRSVADHPDVHGLGHQVDRGQRRHRPGGRGEVGDHHHVREVQVGRVQR